MNEEQLIKKIIQLNTEIDTLQQAREELKAQLCRMHTAGDKVMSDTGQTLTFAVRHTVNTQAVETLPAFKKLPKEVRDKCYVSKLDTKRVAALGVDLSPATKISGVYVTIR